MVVDVTDELPGTGAPGCHLRYASDAIVKADGRIVVPIPDELIPMQVKNMTGTPVCVDIPQDFVILTHFKGRIVRKDSAVYRVEERGFWVLSWEEDSMLTILVTS
jgi:hypothetical protein